MDHTKNSQNADAKKAPFFLSAKYLFKNNSGKMPLKQWRLDYLHFSENIPY
jgi:hypothetical protein